MKHLLTVFLFLLPILVIGQDKTEGNYDSNYLFNNTGETSIDKFGPFELGQHKTEVVRILRRTMTPGELQNAQVDKDVMVLRNITYNGVITNRIDIHFYQDRIISANLIKTYAMVDEAKTEFEKKVNEMRELYKAPSNEKENQMVWIDQLRNREASISFDISQPLRPLIEVRFADLNQVN